MGVVLSFETKIKFDPKPGCVRKIMGQEMLPTINKVTTRVYDNVNRRNNKVYPNMRNDNYYMGVDIDRGGFARGYVCLGNVASMISERRNHHLLKAFLSTRL